MPEDRRESRRIRIGVLSVTVLTVAAVTLIAFLVSRPFIAFLEEPERFRAWIDGHGVWGVLAYIGMVVLQILAAVIPGEPFEIAAGYAFGAVRGTVFCLLAEGIGSLCVLLLVRKYGLRLCRVIFSEEKIASVRFLRGSRSKLILFALIFALPGTPKDLLCYFAGLTDLPFVPLLLICSLGRFPSVVTSVMGGSSLGEQNYLTALLIFAVTAAVSGAGLLIYRALNRRRTARKERSAPPGEPRS